MIRGTGERWWQEPFQCENLDELGGMQSKVDAMKRLQSDTAAEFGALMPSILDKAFRRELGSHGKESMDLRE